MDDRPLVSPTVLMGRSAEQYTDDRHTQAALTGESMAEMYTARCV